jgi:hypothetical protein
VIALACAVVGALVGRSMGRKLGTAIEQQIAWHVWAELQREGVAKR